jgi:hypothetical protein
MRLESGSMPQCRPRRYVVASIKNFEVFADLKYAERGPFRLEALLNYRRHGYVFLLMKCHIARSVLHFRDVK